MIFNKGFTYMGKPYGWHKKKLYKLPYKHPNINRWYNLLNVAKWIDDNDNHKGFILGNHRKSFAQLKQMTHYIDEVIIEEWGDVPF